VELWFLFLKQENEGGTRGREADEPGRPPGERYMLHKETGVVKWVFRGKMKSLFGEGGGESD